MSNYRMNFEIKGESFKSGYYTAELFGNNRIWTFWLVYENTAENAVKINNSRLMLEYFEALPEGATVNAHNN